MTVEEDLLKSFKEKLGIKPPNPDKQWQSKTMEEVVSRYFLDPAKRMFLDRHTFGSKPSRERNQAVAHLHKHVHNKSMSTPVKLAQDEKTSPGNMPKAPRNLKGARGTHFRPKSIKNVG